MDEKIAYLIEDLKKASFRLKEALALPETEINQDASIQRFEFTFELTWKLMQRLLSLNSIEAYGPRNAIREAAKLGIIDDPEKWFGFLEKRNLIAHTYNEKLAKEVFEKAKEFSLELDSFIEKTRANLSF